MPPHPLELPPTLSPDALDTLTELTGILTRLRTAIQTSGSSSVVGGLTTGATPAGTGPGATPNPLGSAASPNAPLSLKDVPAQTDALKHKLQRARTQMRTLPDMERTVDEQEEEIKELEERIRMQREVLDRLRDAGVKFGHDEGGRGDKMETE
ncbi:RNA polymerase II transcription mediator complex subunit 9-domain-containing protein [Colletotrichum godetiae]|uniref:Mediator of RNA polymerase II transcription subunit 9 n=1 Tax=Colletotrichum godetiae TaxID=1209918 RepID=A0AAJ0ALN9_9PEZI|nr:RNA polymerase II transcription mediator complex subunit 9-domain-containing protein [Colletotrichum godetiae]KAK1673966.1 RNA polymerase II transcription mediator complex subunit 9-domain-containing protein [Colletotrichum godetiae]